MLLILFRKDNFILYYYQELILSETLVIDNIIYRMDIVSKENDGFMGFYD